jgi:hypothetical protein
MKAASLVILRAFSTGRCIGRFTSLANAETMPSLTCLKQPSTVESISSEVETASHKDMRNSKDLVHLRELGSQETLYLLSFTHFRARTRYTLPLGSRLGCSSGVRSMLCRPSETLGRRHRRPARDRFPRPVALRLTPLPSIPPGSPARRVWTRPSPWQAGDCDRPSSPRPCSWNRNP